MARDVTFFQKVGYTFQLGWQMYRAVFAMRRNNAAAVFEDVDRKIAILKRKIEGLPPKDETPDTIQL